MATKQATRNLTEEEPVNIVNSHDSYEDSEQKYDSFESLDYFFPWPYSEVDTEHAWLLTSGWYYHD